MGRNFIWYGEGKTLATVQGFRLRPIDVYRELEQYRTSCTSQRL